MFVLKVGGASYVKLEDLDVAALPEHGKLHRFEDDYVHGGVARVRDADVPEADRAWAGAELVVDGKCHARVTGFAVIARLTGDPDYAGIESDHWQLSAMIERGNVILAAKLDGCTGSWARDAKLPSVIFPETVGDGALRSQAPPIGLAS